MAGASSLASIEDIETLWAMLQQEIVETGKVTRFNHLVTKADGEQEEMEIVRVGAFNIVSENGYLRIRLPTRNRSPSCCVSLRAVIPVRLRRHDERRQRRRALRSRCHQGRHSRAAGRITDYQGPHRAGRHRRLLHHCARHHRPDHRDSRAGSRCPTPAARSPRSSSGTRPARTTRWAAYWRPTRATRGRTPKRSS